MVDFRDCAEGRSCKIVPEIQTGIGGGVAVKLV